MLKMSIGWMDVCGKQHAFIMKYQFNYNDKRTIIIITSKHPELAKWRLNIVAHCTVHPSCTFE